ncbi:MAG: hypothetical protein KI792_08930 [Alphaproteobacteria bacterium]|nr:hypothetical protein [Alphaproteobacteria bacterium SS10]
MTADIQQDLADRWRNLMTQWGLPPCVTTFNQLIQAYDQGHRYYHNLTHLAASLRQLDLVADRIEWADRVAMAIWFHDAIYNVHADDNEQRSADWLGIFLDQHQVDQSRIRSVQDMILATKDHNPGPGAYQRSIRVMLDIDLAILGSKPRDFVTYEEGIRREYSFVPNHTYRAKRSEILRSFLARPQIYKFPYFLKRYEEQARVNLMRAVSAY